MPKKLTNLRIDEISTVDRGAGRGVRILLMKRDDAIKRAEDANKALELALTSILGSGDKVAKTVECFKQFHAYLTGDQPLEDQMPLDLTKQDLEKMIADSVVKALAEMNKGGKERHTGADASDRTGGSPDETGGGEGATDKNKTGKPPMDDEDADKLGKDKMMNKKDEQKINAEIAKRDDRIAKLEKQLGGMVEERQKDQFAKRAKEIGLTETQGDILLKAHRGDVESLRGLEDIIKALNTQVNEGKLFDEFGSVGKSGASAHDELEAKAQELFKADTSGKLTKQQAYVLAMEKFPEIAKREAQERQNKVLKLAS